MPRTPNSPTVSLEDQLNNHLAVIMGWTELLVWHPRCPESLKPGAAEVLKAVEAAACLLSRHRQLTRLRQQANHPHLPPTLDLDG